MCLVCNGAFKLGRIHARYNGSVSKCTVITREGNLGGDINPIATLKVTSIKRMLQNHTKSQLHKFCAGLATAHRDRKRSLAVALTTSDELIAGLFRTALEVVDEYGSFLSFEKSSPLRSGCGCRS